MITFIPWADSPLVIAAAGITVMIAVPLIGAGISAFRFYRIARQHEGRIA